MRVLVVDDDAGFRMFTTTALEQAGMEYVEAASGSEGLSILRAAGPGDFDVVLLDVEMPGGSGWDLLLEIRAEGNEVPVLFVTARVAIPERVKGLNMGADDYVIKPVEYAELIARIESVVRRRQSLPIMAFGDIELDLARRRAKRAGKAVHLSPKEFDLVFALVQANGAVLSREQLLREVWEMDFDPNTNVVEVHIARLRKKLDEPGRPMISTEVGRGYRLVAHKPELR